MDEKIDIDFLTLKPTSVTFDHRLTDRLNTQAQMLACGMAWEQIRDHFTNDKLRELYGKKDEG